MKQLGILTALILTYAACSRDGGDDLGVRRTEIHDGTSGRPLFVALSPDSRRIAFSEPVEGLAAIFVMNLDGSGRVRLTHGTWDVNPVWSPDGRWIAYHAENPDHDLWVVAADGGEPRALTASRTDDLPIGWLADGSAVVYLEQGAGVTRTMVAPLEGGAVRPFGPSMEGNVAAVPSPDGRSIAMNVTHGGRTTVWAQMEGESPRQLTTEGFEMMHSRSWSRDGRYIVFTSRRTGTNNLWIAEVATGELRQLTHDVRDDFDGVWSPDGNWIAFRSLRGGQMDVWIVPAAGGQPRRITADRAIESQLHWSGDGRSVLFHRTESSAGLHTMSAAGGAPTQIMEWRETVLGNADLSMDGRSIVFQSNRSGFPGIWIVPVSGGEPTPLAASSVPDVQPRWSPDGRRVAFSSSRGGTQDIWVVNADDSGLRQLTDWPSAETWPVWSPDGSLIAFTSNRDATLMEIWVAPANGGEARRVTRNNASARDIKWTADGREILYVGAAAGGLHGIYRVAVAGGEPRLIAGNARIGSMSLSPDGNHVAFITLSEGWGFLDVVPTAGGASRRLATRTERIYHEVARWSPNGGQLVVVDYDFAHDASDLAVVTWPGGEWRKLTDTPAHEHNAMWSPDGQSVLFAKTTSSAKLVRVDVGDVQVQLAQR